MTDIHNLNRRLEATLRKVENSSISKGNKKAIFEFHNFCFSEGIGAGKIQRYVFDLEKIANLLKKEFVKCNREDIPEIDKMAIREAIINAFCHRNYYLYDSVNIAIFKDRLEIRSPGLLYGGLTIEKIKSQEVSERRNELLAEMFHKVHLVEKWGRGIKLILSKEPLTEFKEIGRQFVVVFKRKHIEKATDRVGVKLGVKVTEKDTERDTEKDTEKLLSKEEKNILKLFRDNPKITSEELSKLLEINLRNTKKRIGPDKGGYWEIVRKDNE